jgi:alpha-L-fucosidase
MHPMKQNGAMHMTARHLTRGAVLAALIFGAAAGARAQEGYQPTPENLAARQWFQDAKFGMFIHWGIYSVLEDGEWVMQNHRIPAANYEYVATQFNPTKFDPAEWVAIVKAAGMRYITITSKHHDGFAMFDSRVSDWDIVDRTPYGKDVLRMLADEARRQGIKLFFYHSQLDWHNVDYYPRGGTGRYAGRPDSGSWQHYLDYMDAQLTELLTNYGRIGGIWFDGMWDKPDADWQLGRTYALIHRLQPAALIGSNHHRTPFPGEDFQMFEKDLPGSHTTGFNQGQPVSVLPLETCETINDAWGFNLSDQRFKSVETLVQYLVRAAGHNANFLLNVGPRPDGTIPEPEVDRLRAMGAWLQRFGTSIYGTRGGPTESAPWGVTTQRNDTVFVHVLDWDQPLLALPPLPHQVRTAVMLDGGARVRFTQSADGVVLSLPPAGSDTYDRVVILAPRR